MANDRSLDGLELSSLNLPYNVVMRDLDDTPRLVGGSNSYVTYGGKLVKRPGTTNLANTSFTDIRFDRLWLYETLDTPSYVYIVASVFDGGSYAIYYIRLDAVSPAWTALTNFRTINSSERPHEAVVSRGLLYIKGYPSGVSGEKLGTVIFDGTGGTVVTKAWGSLGPSTPARISGVVKSLNGTITNSATSLVFNNVTSLPSTPFNIQIDFEVITVVTLAGSTATVVLRAAQGTVASAHADKASIIYRDWSASAHPVAINMFWGYTYAYKSRTGNITNRAPVETNPDNLPSQTGPFTNLVPKITVQGLADTTNFPKIMIYRTSDGGGTYMLLEEITNSGVGDITYEDKSRASTGGNLDPVADKDLNAFSLAPSLTSNSPPPTVLAPLVTGTDTPAPSTPVASFAGRLWLGIGNTLFFSANEELNVGIPEETFPSGLNGNYFRFQYPVVNLTATSTSLYVITTQAVYEISGSTRETFSVRPILDNVGGAPGHPRALTKYSDTLVWLTNDLRIAILQGNNFRTISEPLGTDYTSRLGANVEVDLKYWAELDKEWIVLTTFHKTTPTSSRTWVYNIQKSIELKTDFWSTPWTIPCTAIASGRIRETTSTRDLIFFMYDPLTSPTGGTLSKIVSGTDLDPGADKVFLQGTGVVNRLFDFSVITNLFEIPVGDHINTLRRPDLSPDVYSTIIDRTRYNADVDPTVSYYINDLWTTPIPTSSNNIAARDSESIGYKTMVFPIQKVAKRFALRIQKLQSTDLLQLQNLAIVWNGDAGAGL